MSNPGALVIKGLAQVQPRSDLFQLWRLERERVSANAARFDERKYVEFTDERVRPDRTKAALIRDIEETLKSEPDVEAVAQFGVPSPKRGWLGFQSGMYSGSTSGYGGVGRRRERRRSMWQFWAVMAHERRYGTS